MTTTLVEGNGVRVRAEDLEGFHFLHLDVDKWSLSAYKLLKTSLKEIRKAFADQGVELLFVRTDDEKIVKFWGRLHPLEEVNKFGPRNEYYIGAWETGDTHGT